MNATKKKNKSDKVKIIEYVLSTYSTELPKSSIKQKALLEFISKHSKYGRYFCHVRKKSLIIFSEQKGYLFGEHLNKYKRNPNKYIYIEKKQKDEDVLIVAIYNGSVFYEGKLKLNEQIEKQLDIVLNLDENVTIVNTFGISIDDPIVGFLGDKIKYESLKSPISNNFKPDKQFFAHVKEERSKRRIKLYLFLLIFSLLVSGFFMYKTNQDKIKSNKVMQVNINPYKAYKSSFQSISATSIISYLYPLQKKLKYNLNGDFKITNIEYSKQKLKFSVSLRNTHYSYRDLLEKTAKKLKLSIGYNRNYLSKKNTLIESLQNHIYYIPKKIVKVKPQVISFYKAIEIMFGKNVSNTKALISEFGVYNKVALSFNVNNITMNQIRQIILMTDKYPARIKYFKINNSKSKLSDLYNFIYKANFYGE